MNYINNIKSTGVEEFRLVEKIKLSYLKNRGDLFSILKDVEFPEDKDHIEYVQRLIKKFRGAEEKDVSVLIANNLMSHVLLGTESRCSHLMEMLRSLDKSERPAVSVCHNSTYKVEKDEETELEIFRCCSCQAPCEIHHPPKAMIYKLKLDLLEQLREEDLGLVDMAEKMGYTNKTEAPPTTIINNKPNVLIIGGNKDTEVADKRLAEEYTNMPQVEKARLIEKLKKEIVTIDAEPIEESEETKIQSS